MAKRIAVFGAGIAGLTVAHELVALGHEVTIYEAAEEAGGFFRSARLPEHDGMPSEYSWHGLGPWYHNTFAVMREIPSGRGGSVYDDELSRPMTFGIAPDRVGGMLSDADVFDGERMYRMSARDRFWRAWLLAKTWLSDKRSRERYGALNASEAWRRYLSRPAWLSWRGVFGPWVGSDWTNVSLHTVGAFFFKNVFPGAEHEHAADASGPAWRHGGSAEWLLLRGPSSEAWFDRWVDHLTRKEVRFRFRTALERLGFDGLSITHATVIDHGLSREVAADAYVLATTPFAAADVLERTPQLAAMPELSRFDPLTRRGPHAQISFRIAFSEPIRWPRERAAVVVGDSPWNLTLFAQEQAWHEETSLGDGVRSLWTGTACACTVPGTVYGLPAIECTKEQFVDEILAQLAACKGLDVVLRMENAGRGLADFERLRVEVWHEWRFSPSGIGGGQPKFVNDTTTQPHHPDQRTPVANLALAGAHTRTQADLWSIEGAVESGRRAARLFDPRVPLVEQRVPWPFRFARSLDNALYRVCLPHLLDVSAIVLVILGLLLASLLFL